MNKSLHIQNACVWDGDEGKREIRDLYTKNGRIVDSPAHDALVVDLEGYTLFPGLINAHDHLELNHYPRTKFREVYNNAHEWGEDVNARLNEEPFKSLRAYPLWDRVFIGGLKNLLCGATTVVHHGPPHKPMFRRDFPVRVLKKYGWAHSLHFSTDEEIVRSYQSTPIDVPWFIHLAEGTDDVAASEYQRLKALGCFGKNTVIVHGVGLQTEDIFDSHYIFGARYGYQMPVVWCPTTNIYLLNQTYHPRFGWNTQPILGSDSRLTADGDLLDEMRWVSEAREDGADNALSKATRRITRWGVHPENEKHYLLKENAADFVVIPNSANPALSLCKSKRADLALIMYRGVPQIGDPDVMAKFPHIQTVVCALDGIEKRIHLDLARQIHQCKLKERGLVVDALPENQRYWRLF